MKKRILTISLSMLLALVLAVGGYLGYVLLSYYRLEDDLKLEIAGKAEELVPVNTELSAVSYNIGFGAYSDDYSFFMDGGEHARAFSKQAVLENTKGALELASAAQPSFLLFQEVDVKGTRSYGVDQTGLLAEAFAEHDRAFAQNYDSPYFLYPFHQPIGANRSGMMTFSAYDITSAVRKSLPIEESLYKYLDLDRAYSVSVIPTENGKSLYLYNVHLSAYTSDGTIADEQFKLLCADMKKAYEAGNYVIAGGDFNKDLLGNSGDYFERSEGDHTWAKPLNTQALPEQFQVLTGQNAPTCRNADAPYRGDGTDFVLSVDGFIVSDNIKVTGCETVSSGFAYSDHDPVCLKFSLDAPTPAQKLLETMTLEEKVGQLLIASPEKVLSASRVTAYSGQEFVCPVGGILLFSPNIRTPDQCTRLIGDLQAASGIPLFMAVDEEGGEVARLGNNPAMGTTQYPPMGQLKTEAEACAAGKTIGTELQRFGFNLDFAPVADVNSNPKNPIIGTRAFSPDPAQAAKLVASAVRGFRDSGMLCTLKHFPGHGDTGTDSHKGYAMVDKTLEQLRQTELVPFAAGIEAGAEFVMMGHLSTPQIVGGSVPASLSPEMVSLLRQELGFEGLIITDAMDMGAITKYYSSAEGAVLALEAGVDIILEPKDLQSAYEGVLAAVKEGRLTEARIDESVLKILELKYEKGIISQ